MTNFKDLIFAKKKQKKTGDVALGKIRGGWLREEKLTETQLNHHVHIVGATGFGKTVLISHILKKRIQSGAGLLFIDLKADRDTIEKFIGFVDEAGRSKDLQMFSLTDIQSSSPYNLLNRGTATELRDRIVSSLSWTEEFYKNVASSFLLKLFISLCWLRDHRQIELNLGLLNRCIASLDCMEETLSQIPQSEIQVWDVVESLVCFSRQSGSWEKLQGLRTQLESIVLSDFGKLFTMTESGIDLFETAQKGKITFMFLDTRRYGETARGVGRLILEDLKAVSARIDAEVPKACRKPFSVIIDEFADFARDEFIGFLDRARSSGMHAVLSHQEIGDLLRVSPDFPRRLMGNTATLYAFLQKQPESAELIAKMAGTEKGLVETVQVERRLFISWPTGVRSQKTVEEYIIHPNVIKSLPVGRCVCIKKYPLAQAYQVDIARGS